MLIEEVMSIPKPALRPGAQVLAYASGEAYIKEFAEIIEHLAKRQGRRGILISTQWSANALTRRISLSKMPRMGLKVIDTISLSLGSRISSGDDFVFLSTPVSLESILIEIERILRSQNNECSFLVLDSFTSLKRYYTQGQLSEFFHFLLNRMLEEQLLVVMFDQEAPEGSRVSMELSSTIDHTFLISPGGGKK
ncbi:MAG: hypothetical protein JXA22_05700 [Candidatus Thermoplasmatota archaeon]|nr:hypothetical protein [Candidatus Thermoplasmatota archaeon]